MHPTRKKSLAYFVIGMFFLLGGVEYAVILPTAWLYLSEDFHCEPYMLGLLLSAFCFSGLFAAPIMGRWCDKTGKTKLVFLIANFFEIAGNIMYYFGLSGWFLVASRLVAGVGTGIAAALLADISRVTSLEERTKVMSTFMAIRQIGLIMGPGCNLFLREMNFSYGHFHVTKYNVPGLFMALMWSILQFLVFFLYTDLPVIFLELRAVAMTTQMEYDYSSHENTTPPQSSPLLSSDNTYSHAPVTPKGPKRSRTGSRIRKLSWPPYGLRTPVRNRSLEPEVLTSSSEWIESAEQWIDTYQDDSSVPNGRSYGATGSVTSNGGPLVTFGHASEGSIPNAVDRDRTSSTDDSLSIGPVIVRDHRSNTQNTNLSLVTDYNDSPSEGPSNNSHSLRYYYNEFMREEIIAMLAVVFMSFFAQMSLESMLTPLTQALFDWGELENSLVYLAAGIEILIVFLSIRCLSARYSDRQLLLFGLVMEVITSIYYLWFLPSARQDWKYGQPVLLVCLSFGVFVNILGLPFLFVTSVSLYSKVTRPESQGFAQGLRRLSGGLAQILGPLWATSLIPKPYTGGTPIYLLMGVLTALMVLALVMLLLSFHKLKTPESPAVQRQSRVTSGYPEYDESGERQPLLLPNNRSVQ